MRTFSLTLVSVALVLTSGATARAPRPSRASRSLGGLHIRQTSEDTCASLVDEPLVVDTDGVFIDYGDISSCLCLSDVSAFVDTNAVAQNAVAGAGVAATTAAINQLILVNGEQCTYPAGSTPACTADDPCGFTCDNGFTASPAGNPTTCTCEAPAAVCNGVCTTDACPSAGVNGPGRRGYMNSLRKRAMCPADTTACGVYERRGARSSPFECIHTDSDLESCGGCTTPLDAFSPKGVDCTQIPGVVDVKCLSGACVVNRCGSGYTRSADQSTCVSIHRMIQQIN